MNKIFLFSMLMIFGALFTIDYVDAGVCCDKGCFPDANVCCGLQGQTVGVKGCINPSNNQPLCQGSDFRLGQCLICGANSQWVEDTQGLTGCNACVVEKNAQGQAVNSVCDSKCPEGKLMCSDGICRENCGIIDSDGDGMPDKWELDNGLNPNDPSDALKDNDGDGFTNIQEYQMGTNPNKSNNAVTPACISDGICGEGDSCQCADCEYKDADSCIEGLVCSDKREVCSGDFDGDEILNDDDICIDVADPKQEDEDGDCYLTKGGRSKLFGYCGDACEGEFGLCESVYGDKQCCNNFAGTQGSGQFFGFTEDCPTIEAGVGCWTSCYKKDGDNVITYKAGACVDGKKVIRELTNGIETDKFEESCSGIALVPFFTWINILITSLILIGYYLLKK